MTATSFNKLMHDKATETATMFAKMQIAGHYTAIEKSGWIDIINRHATALFGDASPRNFTKCITENEEGRLYFQALKFAEGSEIKPQPAEAPKPPQHIGPHHARLAAEATARQRERAISYPAAVYEVLQKDPKLAGALRDEHLAHALSMMGGSGGATGSRDISQARRFGETEPTGGGKVRDFPSSAYGASQARKNAEERLQELADQRHAAHPAESHATSYTKVLTDPQHAEIRKAALVA